MPVKRRKYFIEKRSQSRFILRFVLVAMGGGLAAVLLFNFLALRKIDEIMYSMRLPAGAPSAILWPEMVISCLAAIVFTMLVFIVAGRRLFTRIHGPLHKLTVETRRLGAGDLSRKVELRQQDEFQEFAVSLTNLAEELRRRFTAMQESSGRLRELIEKGEGEGEDAVAQLAVLKQEIESLRI